MKRSTEDILLDLEGKINSKMREFNNILYPDIRKTPQINFKAHDSLLLNNINYQATEALLKLYDQYKSLNKQVFLSFDETSSYSPEANRSHQKILY